MRVFFTSQPLLKLSSELKSLHLWNTYKVQKHSRVILQIPMYLPLKFLKMLSEPAIFDSGISFLSE